MTHKIHAYQCVVTLLLLLRLSICDALVVTPGISITYPIEGAVVRPGERVRVKINVDTSQLLPKSVEIDAYMKKPGVFGVLPPVEFFAPPYEADIIVPLDASGTLFIEAGGWTVSGEAIYGPKIAINVISADTPIQINPLKNNLYLDLPSNSSDPLPDDLDRRTIMVKGDYANNIARDISGALFGTTYTSSDTGIITVDAEGVVTPITPGIAFVTVENKGIRGFVKVQVRSPAGKILPIDQTSKAVIQGGGFLFDRASGQYVQQVKITNSSALPIPKPFSLIVTGLPNGVNLAEGKGETRTVVPLGSPYVDADNFDGSFLPPGQSTTVTLRFFTINNQPITYTPKLYTGNKL